MSLASTSQDTLPASRRPSRITAQKVGLLVVILGGAAAISFGAATWMVPARKALPSYPPIFARPQVIGELAAMQALEPKASEWPARQALALYEEQHFLGAMEQIDRALRLGASELQLRPVRALCYRGLEQSEKAVDEWKALSEKHPRELLFQTEQAADLVGSGKLQEARQLLAAIPRDTQGFPALEIEGGRVEGALRLLAALELTGQPKESLELARIALKEDPNRFEAHLAAGRLLLAKGETAEAGRHLALAVAARPGDPTAQLERVRALLAGAEPHRKTELRELLEQVVGRTKAPTQAHYELARIYERERKWGPAARQYYAASQGLTTVPEMLQLASRAYLKAGNVEDGIYSQGRYYEALEQFDAAEREYRKLTKIHSCCQNGYIHVARVQGQRGQSRAALASLLEAGRREKPTAKLYHELARAYGILQEPANERRMLDKMIVADDTQADVAYQRLGALADSDGKIEEAERHYRKCVELQPDADLYRVRLAKLLLQRRADTGRVKEAIEHLERAVRLAPHNSDGFYELGIAYRYANRNSDAVMTLRHAIDLEPGDGRAYKPLGEVLIAQGKREEGEQMLASFKRYRQFYQAWETLRARTRRNPTDIASRRQLAAFLEGTGAEAEAANVYAEILRLDPRDRTVAAKLDSLYRRVGRASALHQPGGVSQADAGAAE